MLTTTFIIISSILFLGMAIIWSRRDFLNLFLKVVFFVMTFIGALLLFDIFKA